MDCSVWLFFLSTIFACFSPTTQKLTYRYHFCINNTNYPPSSTFPANLNSTLFSLYSNAARSKGFYNTSTGQSLNRAYGLFLCRGDLSPDLCQSCIKVTSEDVINRCPNQKEAIIWYDECMLRYSNRSIFSNMEQNPWRPLWNVYNVTNQSQFNVTLAGLMNRLVPRAVNSSNLFATEDVGNDYFSRLYGLMQCTPDISPSDCNICLSGCVREIPNCCDGKQGGRVLKPSCNIRYEIYPFYSTVVSAPAPSPPTITSPSLPPLAISTNSTGENQISSQTIITITVPTVVFVVLLSILCYIFLTQKMRKRYDAAKGGNVGDEITTVQSLQFDLDAIQAATNNFSHGNKIGEGGFGSVYKGIFPNGQAIAVKRLSRNSGQGAGEFRNEAALVAKLQHRNLVRLLGFCLEGQEKILVYEFVTNKSLDYFLFDPKKRRQLNWSRRYKIIGGTARGLLYLHEDSRLRIIHRDLKASNVLLDEDMNPKISDFGMARIFRVEQSQVNTSRVVGTYGYMSPEYAMHGQFSVKSDVFSFGVLILEIISGKKNSSFNQSDYAEDLLSYAWKHWRDGTPLELIDPTLRVSYSRNEVTRCIHIGLLCVQEDPDDRPAMTTIVLMLDSFSITLPLPKQPAFFVHSGSGLSMPTVAIESDQSTSRSMPSSVNDVSITELYPR